MGNTRNTGYLQNIVQYDASNNIILPSLIGTGTRMVVSSSTGLLSTQAIPTLSDLSGVPTSRTLTINGVTYDLTANRAWSALPVGGAAGDILAKIDGTDYNATWIPNYTSTVKHYVKLGENMTAGTPVYVSGSTGTSGTNMIVSKASNASEATSSKTIGLIATGGVTNDEVFVVTEGLITGLDTSTATANDPVWLGVNGALIFGLANKPYAPAHLVFLGIVTRVQQNNGEIFVKVQNGFELDELHDLSVRNPSDGDMIKYVASTGLWTKTAASTTNITEGTNLYYTNARARLAISLTTSGTSGAATYDNTTGVLNIPQYQGGVTSFNTRTGAVTLSSGDVTTALGYTPVTNARTLTINGESYDLSANRSWTIAPDTSVRNIYTFTATAAQTTFTIEGGYTVGLIDVFINGVKLASADFTATNGTTVVLGTGTGVGNIVEIVKYVSAFTTAVENIRTLTINGVTYDLSENRTWSITNASLGAQPQLDGTGLVRMSGTTVSYDNATYATQSYVTTALANLVDSAPGTLDTLNELAAALGDDPNFATTVATSIGTKQPQLNGTGFVKISGTTISYDNSTYLTTASASSTYLPLAGGTLTGTSASTVLSLANSTGGTKADFTITENTGLILNSYEGASARSIDLRVGGTSALLLASTGAATFTSSVGVGGSISGNYPLTIRSTAADYTKILDWGTGVGGSWGTMTINISAPYQTILNSGAWQFNISGTQKMLLDNSGNLGLGVTPSAWTSTSKALQLPSFISLSNQHSGALNLMSYAYESSANVFTYGDTGVYPTRLCMNPNDGTITFFGAGTGTIGNVITWASRLAFTSTGAATFSSSVTANTYVEIVGDLRFNSNSADRSIYFRGSAGSVDGNWKMGNYLTPTGATVVTAAATVIDVYGGGGSIYGFMVRNTLNSPLLQIAGNTGAATFSSSVTATGLNLANSTNGFVGLRLEGTGTYSGSDWIIYASSLSPSSADDFLGFYNNSTTDGATADYKFRLFKTGAASFSSSITNSGNSYTHKAGGGGTPKQVVVGQTTAAASGVAKKIAYVGYTHSVRVYVWANQNASNGSSAIADICTVYGASSGGTVVESNFGNVTDITVAYNNGGSPAYTIDVTVNYSGAAPTINYVIEGINNDNNIYTI
jgi:hypothetical protein